MYEWENEMNNTAIENRKAWLRFEIKRISETTLRGNFSKKEDREYWVKRLDKLNSELIAMERK